MGIYVVLCAICNKPFHWFSGSNIWQVCPDCLEKTNKDE